MHVRLAAGKVSGQALRPPPSQLDALAHISRKKYLILSLHTLISITLVEYFEILQLMTSQFFAIAVMYV